MTCWDEKMPVFYDNLVVVLFGAIKACSHMDEFRHLLCFSCVNYFWKNVEVTKLKALGDNEGIWGNFLKNIF